MQSQRGVTLIVVLIVLTITSLLGIASLRNSLLQMKLSQSHFAFKQAGQKADTAIHCVLEYVLKKGVDDFKASEADEANEDLILDACPGATTQDLGQAFSVVLPGSDTEIFQVHRYLTTGKGVVQTPVELEVSHQQAWEIVLPKALDEG